MFTSIKQKAFQKFKQAETLHHELNYLFWECTTRCNLNCLHCGSDCSTDNSTKDMPLDDFLSALDTIENPAKSFTVVLTGGEPLLRTDLETCGREIRKRGMRWAMVSNGSNYTAKRHNSLLNAGLDALTISLDGLENTHNWLRNNITSFQKTIGAIELAAKSKRLNFDIVTCVHQRNIHELAEIQKLLITLGVKAWRLFTITPIGRAKNNPELLLTNQQFVELIEFIVQTRKNKAIKTSFSCEGFVGHYETKVRDGFFFCRAGINIGSVLTDGSISACPNIDRTFTQGNIYKDNFFKVWQNKFEPFRNRQWTRTGQCKTCNDYSKCQGNGFHNWHGNRENVLVCHNEKVFGKKNK